MNWFIGQMPNETGYKLPVCSWFLGLIVSQVIVTSAFLVLYGLIVAQVTSAILFYGLIVAQVISTLSVLYGLIVVQVTSAFLVLWFDCGASHKRVLSFMV